MKQGLYVHIPYCYRKCHYCDFHISTGMKTRPAMVRAMVREIALQQNYLPSRRLATVYWGGGTPSLLGPQEMTALMEAIRDTYAVASDAEITLEVNPEDVSPERLRLWHALGFNRLSLGVQSLDDGVLRFLGRRHRRADVWRAFREIERGPIENVSIDLIFGMAGLSDALWRRMLAEAAALPVVHMSVYELTVEGRNLFAFRQRQGRGSVVRSDAAVARQFRLAHEVLERAGFAHYEISNYARSGRRSVHNMLYWQGYPYRGIGPSAHSYDGRRRRTNVANNAVYIRRLAAGQAHYTEEVLSAVDRFNEWVLMRLRLAEGLRRDEVAALPVRFRRHVVGRLDRWVASGHLVVRPGGWTLTPEGMLWVDRLASDLLWVDGHA